MEAASLSQAIALALTAGTIATKKETIAPAIKDRHKALKRAVGKKSAEIALDDEKATSTEDGRAALAKDLEKHGATKDRDVIMTARELLALIKVDDAARASVDESMIAALEDALVKLSEVDVEGEGITKHAPTQTKATAKARTDGKLNGKRDPKLLAKAADAEKAKAAEKKRVPPPAQSSSRGLTSSARMIPVDEPSKTELERSILPIHKRTDRFFMKAGVVAGIVFAVIVIGFITLRKNPNEAIESCMKGEAAKCWEVVAAQDAVDQGRNVSVEPLILLCNKHQDACACAGVAYVAANQPGTSHADCTNLQSATAMDPKWPCTCRRYNLWKVGQQNTSHCGIPRCE